MTLQGVKSGDLVKIDKKGRIFFAEVTGKQNRELEITPIQSGVSFRSATAREVVEHYRRSKNGRH